MLPAVTRRQFRQNLAGVAIGLFATAAVLGAYLSGALDWLEKMTLDLRFSYTNSMVASPEIALLDVSDRDLELVGRWPWARDQQAPLVAIPAEFGARLVLVDLTWLEPEAIRSVTPDDADVSFDPAELAADVTLPRVQPDTMLSQAIAGAHAYLAYHYADVDIEHSESFSRAVDALLRGEEAEARRQADRIQERLRAHIRDKSELDLQRPLDRARLVVKLLGDPELDDELAAHPPGWDEEFLTRAIERCREAAVRRRLVEWFDADPARWHRPPHELVRAFYATLTSRSYDDDTRLKRALLQAYREVLSFTETTRRPLGPAERFAAIAPAVDVIEPVYFTHARVAQRCGFSTFEPDRDGTVRRLALLRTHRGCLLSQLGFSVAWDALGLTPERVSVEPGRLTLRPQGRPPLVIQLDAAGRMLVPWVRGREWTRQFDHLPASSVLELHQLRQARRHNDAELRRLLVQALSHPGLPRFHEVARLLGQVDSLAAQREQAQRRGDPQLAAWLEEQTGAILAEAEQAERELRRLLDSAADAASVEAGRPPPDAAAELRGLLADADAYRRGNAVVDARIGPVQSRLRKHFEGRICLVGYTATALADMRPIPTHPSAPGVMAHANLLSGLLTGRLVRWTSAANDTVVAALCGVLVTLVSVGLRPRLAALLVLFAAAAYLAIAGALVFWRWSYWIALTPATAAMIFPFFCVAVYRYVFVDFERRQLSTALSQYTSRQIAKQVADNPELCRRAETREVTAMFTDLRGFTGISERIGAERTQKILNACLGRFTEVMLRHEGMVNKFIGDGIFAFWNPVIYPQPDHAGRACDTALDLLAALDDLRREQQRAGGDRVFDELFVRIGLATGKAVVGPCGSEQKYDYTCIGDSVNVASRLEAANKFFGTQILVNGSVLDHVNGRFACRALGGVQVKGRQQAVPVYELLGRAGQVPREALEYAELFGRGVQHIQRRAWPAAIETFQECLGRRPNDPAAASYLAAAKAFLETPPPADWSGALELTGK